MTPELAAVIALAESIRQWVLAMVEAFAEIGRIIVDTAKLLPNIQTMPE